MTATDRLHLRNRALGRLVAISALGVASALWLAGCDTGTNVTASAGSSNSTSTLLALSVSSGKINPTFAAGTFAYSDSVANAISTVTVAAAAPSSASIINVNGAPVASGAASPPITLVVGLNTITIAVTSADGKTSSTYTLTVTRAAT
jgi:hypothetical protein